MSLEKHISEAVAAEVAKPSVNADASAIAPITAAVMNEVQPRIDYLTNEEPWWRSRVVLGALIIVSTRLLAHFGYSIPEELHGAILDLLIAFGPYLGAAFVLSARYAKKPLGR